MEVAAYITATATVVLAVLTWLNVRASSRLIKTQLEPRIIIAFEQLLTQQNFFGVVMRNVGASPAYQVKTEVRFHNRPVETKGFLSKVREFFNYEWAVVNAKKAVCMLVEMQEANEERQSGSEIYVYVEYSDSPHGSRNRRDKFLITPYWQDGTLLGPPGTWREVDAQVDKITGSIDSATKTIERTLKSLKQDIS